MCQIHSNPRIFTKINVHRSKYTEIFYFKHLQACEDYELEILLNNCIRNSVVGVCKLHLHKGFETAMYYLPSPKYYFSQAKFMLFLIIIIYLFHLIKRK